MGRTGAATRISTSDTGISRVSESRSKGGTVLSERDVLQHFEPTPGDTQEAAPAHPAVDKAALYGLPGEIVRAIEPFTEADPAALLLNALAAFGNVIGCSACATVQNDEHPGRLLSHRLGRLRKDARARAGVLSSISFRLSI